MKKIQVKMTHREAIETIIRLIAEYTDKPHWPGTDWSWRIGINENGEPDATCDPLQSHFNAITIPVIFYDTTASGPIDLKANDEMTAEEKFDWYLAEFMDKEPEGFENLEFKPE